MSPILPRLYAIVDLSLLHARKLPFATFVQALAAAGISLIQLRAKDLAPRDILTHAATLRAAFPLETPVTLIMNDRPDLALLAGFSGVHLGQDDLAPADARRLLGPDALIGLSTHSEAQVRAALQQPIDYLAIGPIFTTSTKLDASPVVGLDLLRLARSLTPKPIVAIGGITAPNARSVLAAGADSLAVISALLPTSTRSTLQVTRDFLDVLG